MEEGLGGISLLLEVGFALCVQVIPERGCHGRRQAAAAASCSKWDHEKIHEFQT